MNAKAKNTIIVVLVIIIGILSIKLFTDSLFSKKEHSTVDSTIIVERIQKVMKLVTVEGNYSELMTYKDFDYINFPGFRKDAIVKVDAKVSVGYNLENMNFSTDEKSKVIQISNFPKPEIISVDTDIKFGNLNTGWFTSFSEAEMTKLNQLAKEKIKQKALNAALINQAEEQKNEILDLIFYFAKSNGYEIILGGSELKPIETTPNNL